MNSSLYHHLRYLFLLVTGLLILSSCGGGGNNVGSTSENGGTAYFMGAKISEEVTSVPMSLAWSLDGLGMRDGYTLNDTAWHLITITVVNQTSPLSAPVAIKGLQAGFYPAPTEKRGQAIEIQDVNCDTAMFSKNGDTCSAYIRVYYDTKTGISNPPVMSTQVVTKAYPNLNALWSFNVRPLLNIPQGDYRNVLPIENRYYVGSAVKAHPYQYQILNMRNISFPALTINQISNLTNPAFKLMQRKDDSSNDPYYGSYSQCDLTENASLNQVNSLPDFESECLLVYEAAATANNAVEHSSVALGTTAYSTAPWSTNIFNLVANYVTGKEIPAQYKSGSTFAVNSGSAWVEGSGMRMGSDGVLSSGTITSSVDPFKLVNISYQFFANRFAPAPYGIPLFDGSSFNVANNTNIGGAGLLTDASTTNPVQARNINTLVAGGYSNREFLKVEACGGAWASSDAYIVPNPSNPNYVRLIMNNNSNGNCGQEVPNYFDSNIPLGYSGTVYHVNQSGCGGGNWDMTGFISVTWGGCSGDSCFYNVNVTAAHGGVGKQCRDSQTRTFGLWFNRPQYYKQITGLVNFTRSNVNPTFVGRAGQSLYSAIGGSGGVVAQSINNCNNGICTVQGVYSNGLSAFSMLYNIGLNAGDLLYGGTVNFTRSEGYDLSTFNAAH